MRTRMSTWVRFRRRIWCSPFPVVSGAAADHLSAFHGRFRGAFRLLHADDPSTELRRRRLRTAPVTCSPAGNIHGCADFGGREVSKGHLHLHLSPRPTGHVNSYVVVRTASSTAAVTPGRVFRFVRRQFVQRKLSGLAARRPVFECRGAGFYMDSAFGYITGCKWERKH